MYIFLSHYAKNKKLSFSEISVVKEYKLNNKKNVLIQEANLWKYFYGFIRNIIKMDFDSREYNPPNSEVNSLISFINALLYSIVLKEILKTNLDPHIAFLHSSKEKRMSLVYDIADTFKPYLTFSILCKVINLKIITKKDFDKMFILNSWKRKKVVKLFNELIEKTYYSKELKRNVSIRYLIRIDLYNLINFIKEDKELKFFKKWW